VPNPEAMKKRRIKIREIAIRWSDWEKENSMEITETIEDYQGIIGYLHHARRIKIACN
jgi:hypothetical protein